MGKPGNKLDFLTYHRKRKKISLPRIELIIVGLGSDKNQKCLYYIKTINEQSLHYRNKIIFVTDPVTSSLPIILLTSPKELPSSFHEDESILARFGLV